MARKAHDKSAARPEGDRPQHARQGDRPQHDKTVDAPPSSRTPRSTTRVKTVIQRTEPYLHAPSTLPPPPFETESEADGLEWWLDSHMALASDLLCLVQMLDAAPDAHGDALRQLCGLCDAVRDVLYELYCDAAHPRVGDHPGFLIALEPGVRASYDWCAAVVRFLAQVAAQLRSGGELDWGDAKATYRQVAAKRPIYEQRLFRLARSLPVDFASPVEPLRNLPANLDHLGRSVALLDNALVKRFA
jgi:hypothetical protein